MEIVEKVTSFRADTRLVTSAGIMSVSIRCRKILRIRSTCGLRAVRTGDRGGGLNRQYHYRAPCSVGKGMENLVENSTTELGFPLREQMRGATCEVNRNTAYPVPKVDN